MNFFPHHISTPSRPPKIDFPKIVDFTNKEISWKWWSNSEMIEKTWLLQESITHPTAGFEVFVNKKPTFNCSINDAGTTIFLRCWDEKKKSSKYFFVNEKREKANFCSKTMGTSFAVFCSSSNCGAGIINGAIKCRLFVDKYLKTCRWVSYTFLQKLSLFNHFWIRPSFSRNFFVCKINDFGEINIWRSWSRRNVMRKKIHLPIK